MYFKNFPKEISGGDLSLLPAADIEIARKWFSENGCTDMSQISSVSGPDGRVVGFRCPVRFTIQEAIDRHRVCGRLRGA